MNYKEDLLIEHVKSYLKEDSMKYKRHAVKALNILRIHEELLKNELAVKDTQLISQRELDLDEIPRVKHELRVQT